jgi:hypothetical protein
MKSFMVFLTVATLLGLSPALADTKGPPPAAQYIGYAWPFADRDIQKDLGQAPVVLELYSTQGCMFCPVADRFFNDLVEKSPSIIGLSCHTSYQDVQVGSYSLQGCNDRQSLLTGHIPGSSVFTPQMIINGRRQIMGHKYDAVYDLLKEAAQTPPALLSVHKAKKNLYDVTVPDLPADQIEKSEFVVIQYLKPFDLVIAEGPNQGMHPKYTKIVSSITPVGDWSPEKKSVQVEIRPDKNAEGAVLMVQNKTGISAIGQIKF